jgi:hypothetical protein
MTQPFSSPDLSGNAYLNSYQPLCYNSVGLRALKLHDHLQPYEDASCRREPDFLHPLAPITGVCRGANFVTRLRPGDVTVYMTKRLDGGHYLTAVLEVQQVLTSADAHQKLEAMSLAAGHKRLPGNCFVEDNNPLPLSHTGGFRGQIRKTHAALDRGRLGELAARIRVWDNLYHDRVTETPHVAVTKPHYVELIDPPFITDEMLTNAFDKRPGTRNPPKLDLRRINILLASAGLPIVE